MQKKYSMILTFGLCFLLLTVSLGYRAEYKYLKKNNQNKKTDITEGLEEEPLVEVQGTAGQEHIFYLSSRNGYVIVLMADQKTVFEYTDIRLADLPPEVQKEIEGGKTIIGEEKLYGFLENYSS